MKGVSYSDKTVESGEVAFLMVTRLPGVTMRKYTVGDWKCLGKVNHPHTGMVASIVDYQQRTADQLTRRHRQAHRRDKADRNTNRLTCKAKGKGEPCPSWGVSGVLISHSRPLSS